MFWEFVWCYASLVIFNFKEVLDGKFLSSLSLNNSNKSLLLKLSF